ncbi:MAG: DUF4292 domain-containing protein [Bacteroidia bacterium]
MRYAWAIMLVLYGCKLRKVVAPPAYVPISLEKLAASRKEYHQLFLRGEGRYTDGKQKQAFQLQIFLARDSFLWASAGFLGFEGVRLLAKKDTFYVLNRLQKTYASHATEEVFKRLGMDFSFTQVGQLLTGDWVELPAAWELRGDRLWATHQGYQWEYHLLAHRPHQVRIYPPQGEPLEVTYLWEDEWPKKILFQWESRSVEIFCQNWQKDTLPPHVKFVIPSTYQKTSLW